LELFGHQSDVGVWVTYFMPLVQDGIAPGDGHEQLLLYAELLVRGQQNAGGITRYLSHQLPARKQFKINFEYT
jgi:hypothetical protein